MFECLELITSLFLGFIAFTTTGYGDYSPKSPAGRSIFVFWALFGVGTMTILVSGKPPLLRSPSLVLFLTLSTIL